MNCGGAGRIEIAFRSRASLVPGLEESAEAPCSCLGFFFVCVCVAPPLLLDVLRCKSRRESAIDRQFICSAALFYFYFLCVAFYFVDKGTKVYRVVLFILFLFLRMKKTKTKKQNQAPSLPITPSTSSTSSNIWHVSIYITNAAGNDTIWIGFHLRFFLSFFLSRPERKIIKSERIIIKEK